MTANALNPFSWGTFHYHLDALGSVRAITDSTGAVVERHNYLAFGQEYQAPASADPRRYAGKEHDAETALDYFGARYLSGVEGRFTTTDPMAVEELQLPNPQRFNRYAAALNSPLTFIDPDGRDVIVVDFKQGGQIGSSSFGHLGGC